MKDTRHRVRTWASRNRYAASFELLTLHLSADDEIEPIGGANATRRGALRFWQRLQHTLGFYFRLQDGEYYQNVPAEAPRVIDDVPQDFWLSDLRTQLAQVVNIEPNKQAGESDGEHKSGAKSNAWYFSCRGCSRAKGSANVLGVEMG